MSLLHRVKKIETTLQAEAKVVDALTEMRQLIDDLQALGREMERVALSKEQYG